LLNRQLVTPLGLAEEEPIHWLSPLKDDDFAEYSDQAFLERLGIALERRPLGSFWPKGGPVWDALAKTDRRQVILVEAKAHIPELVSPRTGATGVSLRRIRQSLAETKLFLGSRSEADWSANFYQYTNRLAHLYLLRELNGVQAFMLFLYFINDKEMCGPSTQAEWKGAVSLLKSFLGLQRHKLSRYVLDRFIDIRELQ
jgi:hypothetical protein